MTIIMLSGKGAFLVAGFNTMSKQEKEKYNSIKVSRNAGFTLVIIDIALLAFLIMLQLFLTGIISNTILLCGISVFMVVVITVSIISCIKGFKKAKK